MCDKSNVRVLIQGRFIRLIYIYLFCLLLLKTFHPNHMNFDTIQQKKTTFFNNNKKKNCEDNFFVHSSSLNDYCLYIKKKCQDSLLMLSPVHSPFSTCYLDQVHLGGKILFVWIIKNNKTHAYFRSTLSHSRVVIGPCRGWNR